MKRMVMILGVLVVIVGGRPAIGPPVRAQGPIALRTVEPHEGQPGRELELTLSGDGFDQAREVRVVIEGIEVLNTRVESGQAIVARVFIPKDAPLGPHSVKVIAVLGPNEEFAAELAEGFVVVEAPAPSAPPALYKVSPSEVRTGSEVELTLTGENFTPDARVSIGGKGIELYDRTVMAPSRMIVNIGVLPDALPGPRLVAVETAAGRAELQGGLTVAGGAPPPTRGSMPAPSGGGGVGLLVLLIGGALLIWAIGFAMGRAVTVRSRPTWQQLACRRWQLEAGTRLPEPKEACTWACKAEAPTRLLKRWKVTALCLTPLPVTGGRTPPSHQITGRVLNPLDEAARIKHAAEDEAQLRQRIAPVAQALLQQILAWRDAGQSPPAIRLDARLAREVKCRFGLYHCEERGKGLAWIKRVKWKGPLHQPGGRFLGILQGPRADEPDFAARAREELEGLLLELVEGVRFKM